MDLSGLSGSLTAMAGTQHSENLAALLGQGLEAASFVASGAHTHYAQLTVDNSGRNTIQWLTDWFTLQIQHTT
jgi:hypothetical protein